MSDGITPTGTDLPFNTERCVCGHRHDKHDIRGCTGTYLDLTRVGLQKRPCACSVRRFVPSSPAAGEEVAR